MEEAVRIELNGEEPLRCDCMKEAKWERMGNGPKFFLFVPSDETGKSCGGKRIVAVSGVRADGSKPESEPSEEFVV